MLFITQHKLILSPKLNLIRRLAGIVIVLMFFGDRPFGITTLETKVLSQQLDLTWRGDLAVTQAQIEPDNTLGNENSQVIPDQNINGLPADLIEGGATRGQNLFHSFSQFNIESGQGAYFTNPEGIANIFSRVTGNDVSNILGTLGVNGVADLFLINPNGIIFGENASLDLNGSFIGSTAQSIVFGNDFEFSAVNPELPPLLTINMPVGLNLGSNGGDITVQGIGNNLSLDPDTAAIVRDSRPVGLAVESGQTLALVGGDITLEGGNLTAPGGRIELGSLGEGEVVKLNPTNSGWTLSYEDVSDFQDIGLSRRSSVDASGSEGSSSIQVQGRQVTVEEQSAILAQPLGEFSGGGLTIKASEEIVVSGFDIDIATVELDTFPSTISTDVQPNATGDADNLLFETKSLRIIDAAQIGSGTFGIGNGATLSVKAEDVELSGSSLVRPGGLFSNSEPEAIGNGGNIEIETEQLLVADGSYIAAGTFSQGNAGNINITAEKVEIIGEGNPIGTFINTSVQPEATGKGGDIEIQSQQLNLNGGLIFSSSFGDLEAGDLFIKAESIELENSAFLFTTTQGQGDAGNLTIDTKSLQVNNSQIGTGTLGAGNAGELEIIAEDIEARGDSFLFTNVAQSTTTDSEATGNGGNLTIDTTNLLVLDGAEIGARTSSIGNAGNLEIRALGKVEVRGQSSSNLSKLTVEAESTSNAGDLSLETGELIVADGGQVTVSSPQGEAGNLQITADSLLLNRGTLSAETGSNSSGANIDLQIAENLQLSSESLITATAFGAANGGNINIDAGFVLAFLSEDSNGSDIVANAEEGSGGLIQINAFGIFGLETSTQLTSSNDITAFSQQNPQLDGMVDITTTEVNQDLGLLQLPIDPISAQVVPACGKGGSAQQSKFIIRGRGGLPDSPQVNLSSDFGLEDWRVLGQQDISDSVTDEKLSSTNPETTEQIVEANRWILDSQGKIILVADNSADKSNSLTQQSPKNCQTN